MGTSTALSQWLAIWSFQSIVYLFFHSLYPFPWRAIPAFRNRNWWGRFQQHPTVFVSFKDIKFYQIVCHLLTTVPNIKHSLKLISTFSYLYYSLIHVIRSPCNMISLTVTTLSPSKILLSLGETYTHTNKRASALQSLTIISSKIAWVVSKYLNWSLPPDSVST